jgi:deoxyribodipyrimidine photo-lyase
MAGCTIGVDYPLPIVDDLQAIKAAKDRMFGLRKTAAARAEATDIQARHGSRKSGLPPSRQRRPSTTPHAPAASITRPAPTHDPQRELFD